MDIASTAPAPSISSLKFRLCSFPLWEGPNPSDWIILEGRAGFFFLYTIFSTQGGGWGMSPDLCPTRVFSISQKRELSQLTAGLPLIPAPAEHHSSASRNTCPKFSSLNLTLPSHVQALLLHEKPLMCKSKPASLAGVPQIHCPRPWDTGPAG